MRDRLIELIDQKQVYGIDQHQPESHNMYLLDNDELADHLLANGVIVPTCKVGDLVYEKYHGRVFEYVVDKIEITDKVVYSINPTDYRGMLIRIIGFTEDNIGKTIFLTREEAKNVRE